MRHALLLVLFAVAAPASVLAQAPFLGVSGGGMLSVQEASVLGPGRFALGFASDNYDRDPLGLDIVDGRFALRLGVTHRLELYGRYEIFRSVSVPGTQEVPPPPLDIVDLSGRADTKPPYRTMYWPMPYLGDEPARVDDMVDGEYALGAKWLFVADPDLTPWVAVSLEVAAPGTMDAWKLRKGSGAGGPDITALVAATWEDSGRWSASANLGYTLTGAVRRADVLVTAHGTRELPIGRADLLRWGLGVRFRPCKTLSFMAETAGWRPVGSRTPVQDDLPNTDVLAGLELRAGPLALTVGVREHLELQRHRQQLTVGPLAGGVDLSAVPPDARRAWLDDIGAPPTRTDANTVVLGVPKGTPLPDGARRIPEFRTTSTAGNGAIIGTVSLRF